ncbi:MAG: hypothetical protein RMJ82_08790 [Gemmatales bacterium]|nr:hypothetical protein [Gemmatales bacterium]
MAFRKKSVEWILALLACFVSVLVSAHQDVSPRSLRIILAPGVDAQKVISALRSLGFVNDPRPALPGELWGRLPAASLRAADSLPGISLLVLEPADTKPHVPERYQVWMRIHLPADARVPSERFVQYHQLTKELGDRGFRQAPLLPEEWRYHNILRGQITEVQTHALLGHPSVRTLLLVPVGTKLEGDPKRLVFVEIWLGSGLSYNDQQLIRREALGRLETLGFIQAMGYDDASGVRVLGWLPIGRLFDLLDAKHEYLFSDTLISERPSAVSLFRLVEVFSEPGKPEIPKLESAALGWPEEVTPELKLSSELRSLLAQGEKQLLRCEIIFSNSREEKDALGYLSKVIPALIWEGNLGPIAWVRLTPEDALSAAKLPAVSSVRLPQRAYDIGAPTRQEVGWRYIRPERPTRRTESMQSLLRWREPIRVAIVGIDFGGWQEKIGKTLPNSTYYVDYTRWMNQQLAPEPPAKVSDRALVVAEELVKAGPVEELYLIRVHESAPYQIVQLLERISGSGRLPKLLETYRENLNRTHDHIKHLERELRFKRASLLPSFREDDPAYWKSRDELLLEEKKLQAVKNEYIESLYKLREFQSDLDRLRRVETVIVVPHWRNGYPSQAETVQTLRWREVASIDKGLSVIQVVPNWTRGDWFGWLRDTNNNGVIEFRDLELPQWVQWDAGDWQQQHGAKAQRWGHAEMNWLGWRSTDAADAPELRETTQIYLAHLPPKVTIEIVFQWKEVHDPRWSGGGADLYRRPRTPWVIEVLEPLAEAGSTLPGDVYRIVAHSQGLPERIENEPRYGVYEMRLRFTSSDKGGRYAVRLRGQAPESTSPQGVPQVRSEAQEVWFRLSAEVVDDAHRPQGHVVWLTRSLLSP